MTKDKLKMLAKELFQTVMKKYPSKFQDWDLVRYDLQKVWLEIAKHVLIRELKAKLECLEEYHSKLDEYDGDYLLLLDCMKAELKSLLKEIVP